jgi:hypothetical protein
MGRDMGGERSALLTRAGTIGEGVDGKWRMLIPKRDGSMG